SPFHKNLDIFSSHHVSSIARSTHFGDRKSPTVFRLIVLFVNNRREISRRVRFCYFRFDKNPVAPKKYWFEAPKKILTNTRCW
ncbi:MAG: hypothetical protein EAZ10_10995, partial [Oscillatoriales cyanobacterium]